MSDHPQHTEPPRYWARSATTARWGGGGTETGLRRFLGGAPIVVVVRLAVVSLVVGALLMWLDIRPDDIYRDIAAMLDGLWALGFRSLRNFGAYLAAGVVIVVPVWLILRLLSYRGR